MQRLCLLVLWLAAITISATAIGAQAKPDFSGVWIPVDTAGGPAQPWAPPQAGGAPPPPPPRTVSLTITQSVMEMKIDRRVDSGGREIVYAFAYKLDGTESVNQMGPMVFRTKATWDGSSLALVSAVSTEGYVVGEVRDTYRLENGDLIVDTVRRTPAGTFTVRSVHRKQP